MGSWNRGGPGGAKREIQDRIDGAVASVVQLIAVGAMVGLGGGLLALGLSFGVAQVFLWPIWGGLLAVGGAIGFVRDTIRREAPALGASMDRVYEERARRTR